MLATSEARSKGGVSGAASTEVSVPTEVVAQHESNSDEFYVVFLSARAFTSSMWDSIPLSTVSMSLVLKEG